MHMNKKVYLIISVIFLIIITMSGCGGYAEKKAYSEKRDFISTSLYKELANSKYQYTDEFFDDFYNKNKDKYVEWQIAVNEINDSGNTILFNAPNGQQETKVQCKFNYKLKNKIKSGDTIVVSGKVYDWETFSSKLSLADCRIENLDKNQIAQLKVDKEAYEKKIDGIAKAEVKKKAEEVEANARAQEEAKKVISTDFISFQESYKAMTELQKEKYFKTVKGRYVQWTGVVSEVDKDSITIKYLEYSKAMDFQAVVVSSEKGNLTKIDKGSTITIKGTLLDGEGSVIHLNNCVIVK